MSNADEEFDKQNTVTDDIPQGGDTIDNSYAGRSDGLPVPVVKDETPVEQPNDEIAPDSDKALERDEAEAIDKSNVLKGGRTRGAKPMQGYSEPGDDEDLPANDGTSAIRS